MTTSVHRLLLVLSILLALVGSLLTGVAAAGRALAAPTLAATAVGRAIGYAGSTGWIGSYQLAGGLLAFCIEAGKPAPPGHDYEEEVVDQLPGHTKEDNARLAWLARTYGPSGDPTVAAAAQLAIWTITGLHGHPASWYAARAGAHADAVMHRADEMLAAAEENASLGVRATLDITEERAGHAVLRSRVIDVTLHGDRPASSQTAQGHARVTGARFAGNDANEADIWNDEWHALDVEPGAALRDVTASIDYPVVAGGTRLVIARSAGAQSVAVAIPADTAAAAVARTTVIGPEPFAPRVVTRTSAVVAAPGAAIADDLDVAVLPGAGLLSEWGRTRTADGQSRPIPVVVRSRLLGPFSARVEPAPTVPADAPEVCTVTTSFDDGPGVGRTPSCEIPSAGWYVWVESIDPADTPAEAGRDRVRPWQSSFGAADEVSLAPTVARITTEADTHTAEPGTCVADHLDVAGLDGLDTAVTVRTTLVGPLPGERADGDDLADLDDLPVAGTVDTVVTADGAVTTDCIRADEPGWYVFVLDSDGADPDADGRVVVPAFRDHRVHDAESFVVRAPATATPTPSATPVALAFTGASGALPAVVVAGVVALVAGALLAGIAVRRRRRGRGADGMVPNTVPADAAVPTDAAVSTDG